MVCPSVSSFAFWASTPPGYFGFNSPLALSVLQYGVSFSLRWKLAYAAMETKIPAVIGSVKSAPLSFAKYSRISTIVMTLPYGTKLITLSYSIGGAKYNSVPAILFNALMVGDRLKFRHIFVVI